MEAVVLQALGDIDSLDARRLTERPGIEDELVRASTVRVSVDNLVVRLEPAEDVVGVQQGNLGGVLETLRSCAIVREFVPKGGYMSCSLSLYSPIKAL